MTNLLSTGIPIVLNYIDPGSGMLILQIVIAGFIGGLVLIRNYITKFLDFVMWWRKRK